MLRIYVGNCNNIVLLGTFGVPLNSVILSSYFSLFPRWSSGEHVGTVADYDRRPEPGLESGTSVLKTT